MLFLPILKPVRQEFLFYSKIDKTSRGFYNNLEPGEIPSLLECVNGFPEK